MAITQVEWLNANAGRAYPLKEDSGLRDERSGVDIPSFMLVDLVLTVPSGLGDAFYLSAIALTSSTLTLTFKDGSDSTIGSTTVLLAEHTRYNAYHIVGVGDYWGARGRAVFGDLSDLLAVFPVGEYTYSLALAGLEPSVVRPDLRGLRHLSIVDSVGNLSDPLSGAIRLVAGPNIRLQVIPAGESITISNPDTGESVVRTVSEAAIQIDVAGGAYDEACDCDQTVPLPDPIRSINGVSANPADGDFLLTSISDCLAIGPLTAGGGLALSDECSEPCCGCAELESLTGSLQAIEVSRSQLETRLTELERHMVDFWLKAVIGK